MATQILPIQKTRTVDYRTKELRNFWRRKADGATPEDAHAGEIAELLRSAKDGVVCIQAESITDEHLIKQLFAIAGGQKVRIYLLVNEYSKELDSLGSICLIRYALKNTGSFILVNPKSNNSRGLFFSGRLTGQCIADSRHILHNPSTSEISQLFKHFCFHFWGTAKKELLEAGKHLDVTSKPLVILHNPQAFGDRDFVHGTVFEFVESARRGEMSGKSYIPVKKEGEVPQRIAPTVEVNLGNLPLDTLPSKEDFENKTPDFPDDGKSCEIEYTWRIIPFYLPTGSADSPLYETWEKENKKIKDYLNTISGEIFREERRGTTLPKELSRFFLGKKTVFDKKKREIEELKEVNFAELPEERLKEKITHINVIKEVIDSAAGEIEQELERVKREEAIEDLRKRKESKSSELEEKHKELEIKQKDKDGKFIQKTKDEIEKLEKDIERIVDEIAKISKPSAKSSQPQAKSALDNLSSKKSREDARETRSRLAVPNLPQLPMVGTMYQHEGQAYLAIGVWEDYEQGKHEAQRLKAKLCATNT